MKITIINRSFWPIYPVIGEALLQLAENLSDKGYKISVILQDHEDIKSKLKLFSRGEGIKFFPVKAFTNSSSIFFMRIFDAFFFMINVFILLLRIRPNRVYIATDPPIVVPFIVMLYCKLFNADYIYHIQDIHPEATNVVFPMNKLVYKFFLKIDQITTRNAKSIVTINESMSEYIKNRSNTKSSIFKVDNPAISFDHIDFSKVKKSGFSFCGNAGRLQRIPLLLESIEKYFEQGGKLEFTFAGGGIYSDDLNIFATRHIKFKYLGVLSSDEAAKINAKYTWALLPIDDEVTKYAFPSKTSSYVLSNAKILAICGENTSVGNWVNKYSLGVISKPNVRELVQIFFEIEGGKYENLSNSDTINILKKKLDFKIFVNKLEKIIID